MKSKIINRIREREKAWAKAKDLHTELEKIKADESSLEAELNGIWDDAKVTFVPTEKYKFSSFTTSARP